MSHMYCFYPWSQVKAAKEGGPPPRCRFCGKAAVPRVRATPPPPEPQWPITIADGTVGMRRGE